jgi:hypothetical protein
VDAVTGRLILMHLPDPVAALRKLATLVRPGGLVVFHEFDISAARTIPELPLFRTVADLITQSFRGVGLSTECGSSLYSMFQQAGLPAPRLTTGAPLGGAGDIDVFAFAIGVWRLMFPIADRLGLLDSHPGLSDIDSLLSELRDEAGAAGAIAVMPTLVSAWTNV